MELLGQFNYWIFIALMMTGFYLLLSTRNLIKKVIGLNLFQTSVFVFYISTGAVTGGAVPIYAEGVTSYSNPLPHVLILTAIVVGVASTCPGPVLDPADQGRVRVGRRGRSRRAGRALLMPGDSIILLGVLIPLLSAPLCVLLGRGMLAWGAATLAAWASFGTSLTALFRVMDADGQVLRYALGGWEAPVGIEYRLDVAGAFVMVVVTAIAAIVLPYSWKSVEKEVDPHRHHWFYACLCLCMAGLLGIPATGDAFNLFVFLEISSLSTYVLVAMGRDRRALTAAFRYLIIGTVGATFYLIGVGFLYQMTGTLNMEDLAQQLLAVDPGSGKLVHETTTVRAALAFLSVGLCMKVAVFPLHLWLPNVYAYAPSVVSAFLSATATKVAILALLRVFYTIDGLATPFASLPLAKTLVPFGAAGAIIASIVAVYQRDVKRLLAYSSVAQVGYMIVGIGLATQAGLTSGLLHLGNHAMMKGALFCAIGCIVYRTGQTRLELLRGIGREMASDLGGHRDRWPEPDRSAADLGLRVQVGAAGGGDGEAERLRGGAGDRQFPDRLPLRRPDDPRAADPQAAGERPARDGGAHVDGGADAAAGTAQPLVRGR